MNVVSDQFHELAAGSVRPLDYEVGISWTKERNEDVSWFTLNQSIVNGPDLLSDSSNNPVQLWDVYDYQKMRDRIVKLNVERSVQFPYNIQCAICDIELNNYDGYFSYDNTKSPLSQYILPARPLRAYLGFKSTGLTPVFVGLTQSIPRYNGQNNTTASITAMDFLATIGDMSLQNMVMMRNARTDEVIAEILVQFGLKPYMFNLDRGINTIPFVYFESGKNAGNALKELVQAENGAMWIDEQGIIRFTPRTSVIGQDSVMTLNPSSIISITPSQTTGIVNKVYIEADVREVNNNQQIFSADNSNGYSSSAEDDPYRLQANGTTTVWLNFDDPIWVGNPNPVLNGSSDSSSFTAVDLSGQNVNNGVSASGVFFATSLKLTFNNTNNFPVSINYLQIWGQPAKVIGGSPTIKYTAQDDESIEAFGLHELSITDNNCFGNQQNIDAFATDVLTKYSGYSPTIELEVKGDPSLQLQDIVTLEDTDYNGTWLIKGISHNLSNSKLATKLTAVRHTVVQPFTLNRSTLNGPDVLS